MAFTVDYTTVGSDHTNYMTLNYTPSSPTQVAMDLVGGTAQALNGDFGVTDSTVIWDSTAFTLFNVIQPGDKIRVIYDRS